MSTDLNTLLTALYVKIDDWLGRRTRTGRPPKLSDAELLTLAVAILLGPTPTPDRHPGRVAHHVGPGGPKLDERQVLMAILDHDPTLAADRPGLTVIADKGYVSAELDRYVAERGATLLRPSYRNRTPRPGEPLLKPVRQLGPGSRRGPHGMIIRPPMLPEPCVQWSSPSQDPRSR